MWLGWEEKGEHQEWEVKSREIEVKMTKIQYINA